VTPPPPGTLLVDFDDADAPCSFEETTALTTRYAGLSVTFAGPAPLDGGGILNSCGLPPLPGFSTPNLLAFLAGGLFLDGGEPRGPETIVFDFPTSYVQINVGGTDAGT